jgi:2,3-bisphosphoglycerate-dependent phosphoglycerate mutase
MMAAMTTAGLELWLVRHGETTFGARQELAGWADPPLTDRGEEEARALKPVLNGHGFTAVWSSDLRRALTTARLAWGEPQTDLRLREIDFGSLEGARWPELGHELDRAILDFNAFDAPDGESVDHLRERALSFLVDLPPGRHLVFTHGGVIRVLTRALGLDRFLGTGALVVVDWSSRQLLRLEEPRPGPGAELLSRQ